MLWITFKSCIFAFWNNLDRQIANTIVVVNYIQILYLCILKQLVTSENHLALRCELHSNLVSLHSETTREVRRPSKAELWITFKSCIFAFWNNKAIIKSSEFIVVNYIQILYLCILKQQPFRNIDYEISCELHSNLVSLHSETTSSTLKSAVNSCELHSNLVSLHSETTDDPKFSLRRWLWITFKSCIFAFWNN